MTDETSPSRTLLRWLTQSAWPLWLERGIDRARGGFNESLTLDDARSQATFRRLRVVARQVYVFSQAERRGLAGADEAVALGVQFLRAKAADGSGGYASRFDLDGKVIETPYDLYDHAFVMLALASAARLLPVEPLRRDALALMGFLDRAFAHPAGGYLESLPPALPRRQNPHMHLLEGCLAAAEAFGDAVFLDRADRLVGLFLERLFDHATGSLPEYFDDDLVAHAEAGRTLVEPGHHCEWIWLLDWHARVARGAGRTVPAAAAAAAAAMQGFVDRHGENPATGTLYDGVWSDGTLQAGGSRLWPQTERIKAERLRSGPSRLDPAATALQGYLTPAGLWHERRLADGSYSSEPAPASSLYHLTAGILFAGEG